MRPRVLVIEDSPLIQKLVAMCLQPLNVDVEQRLDGRSGLDQALDDPPDLVLLDIGLPELDGWGVLRGLRANLPTRCLPVLVLTAHAQEEIRRRAEGGGADDFMVKPFRPEQLRKAVRELLTRPRNEERQTG